MANPNIPFEDISDEVTVAADELLAGYGGEVTQSDIYERWHSRAADRPTLLTRNLYFDDFGRAHYAVNIFNPSARDRLLQSAGEYLPIINGPDTTPGQLNTFERKLQVGLLEKLGGRVVYDQFYPQLLHEQPVAVGERA